MTKVTMMGNPIEVKGHFPQKGEKVENVHFTNKDLADVSLGDFSGKRKVLNIFPSIDTGVCATSVRVFNQQTLSTFRHKSVHDTLGVNITTGPIAGLTARAVIILDENNNVIHSELVSEIKNEPNYDAALAVL